MFMKKITKVAVLFIVVAPLAVFGVTPPAQTNDAAPATKTAKPIDLFATTIVAKGNGVSVTRTELDQALIGIKSSYAARGQPIPPEQLPMIEQNVLLRLIQIQLLSARATDADRAAGKELAETNFAEIKTRAGSDEALDRQLKAVGITREELKAKMIEETVAQTVVKRELKPTVTDADIKKYYTDNPAAFEQPEMVRASHILFLTVDEKGEPISDDQKKAKRKQAEDILKRAKAGEDFAKLAKEFSQDPGSKDKGGEYTFPRGKMVTEFEGAAFSMKTNQISEIITTQYGYHIIKLSEKIPAQKAAFDKVKDDLKEVLTQQAMAKVLPDYLAKLKNDANVEILDEKLKAMPEPMVTPTPVPVPTPTPAKKK
jgi:peptidyl-prolyl cis-trans isomerase C